VRVLLDTCSFLWWTNDPAKLTARLHHALRQPENEIFFSVVSAWEIAIKWRNGRLDLPSEPDGLLPRILEAFALKTLPISLEHAVGTGRLALHHNDPFDRMLIAQAGVEGMMIATPDPAFAPYGVPLFW
jgi:PIN domain nuclease of toxin-antitoxin system